MIDLHLHTTASDGRLPAAELVALAARTGLTIVSVTDHDTTSGLAEARAAAERHGLRLVDGIEITAVESGDDVHVLGYFLDPFAAPLHAFLEAQRADRVRRIIEMGGRLGELGCAVDVQSLLRRAAAQTGRSIGRPQLADALVAAGHAIDRRDAFDRMLGRGCPAYVPRRGPTVAQVIEIIREAGGISSLAHPGLTRKDDEIARFAAAGLAALEACHSDHDAGAESRYRALAAALGLAVSGGSDFHADPAHHANILGATCLPPEDFHELESRAISLHGRAAH